MEYLSYCSISDRANNHKDEEFPREIGKRNGGANKQQQEEA